MSKSINGITNEAAKEITRLLETIHDNEKMISYLMSDSYRETRDPNGISTYWELKHECMGAIIRLNEKFGIELPKLDWAMSKIEYYEDQKYAERRCNQNKILNIQQYKTNQSLNEDLE